MLRLWPLAITVAVVSLAFGVLVGMIVRGPQTATIEFYPVPVLDAPLEPMPTVTASPEPGAQDRRAEYWDAPQLPNLYTDEACRFERC